MSESANNGQNPRVFISYSWDSPEHRLWVESFAQELRKSGIDARLDAWRDESQSIDDFMMVELERAHFIVAICTPDFKRKIVENAEGTATASGFEIGTAAALRRMGGKDVIPVLRAGDWTESAPSSLLSYRFYDFSKSDVSEEFSQLRDRLLGHIRRPPELGQASGPAAAPELPDIFAQGSEPEAQPTAPPQQPPSEPEAATPRAGPPAQQPSQVIIQQAPSGYSKGKVWGTVAAILAVVVWLWNWADDPQEQLNSAPQTVANTGSSATEVQDTDTATDTPVQSQPEPVDPVPESGTVTAQELDLEGIDLAALLAALEADGQPGTEQSSSSGIAPEDRWTFMSGGGGCGVEKQVGPNSWVQVVYAIEDGAYSLGTADPAWGQFAQTGVLHENMVVFQFDDDTDTVFNANVVGYDYDGIPGAFTFVGEDEVNNLGAYFYLHVYLNVDPYIENHIMSFDLTGSEYASPQLLACVANL